MRTPKRAIRGVSLIEAVVALAVMAFGMLAYVGLQSTLRFNSDVSKQRSEAVRIAQESIEEWRAYRGIESKVDKTDYAEIASTAAETIAGATTNTTYTLLRTVVDAGASPAAPRIKTLVVDVRWLDRNGDEQSVRLSTTVAGSPPELAGTLSLPGDGPVRLPQGRHPGIPPLAIEIGGGKSAFKPPDASGSTIVWVFNNLTGVIVGVCNTVTTGQAALTEADVQSCINKSDANGLPLSGFVRFSTGVLQPTAADAENPSSTALNLSVALALTSTGHATPDHACFAAAPLTALTTNTVVPYVCAIFFELGVTPLWSGTSTLTPLAFIETGEVAWPIATDAADATLTRFRVCRYTPATSDAQSVPNQLHPRNYTNVTALEPLTNQNFLVIRAGNGLEPFACPTDVPADPAAGDFVNSNTLPHQPPP